eukprot:SM000030S11497  [mRNA]  locus=s30:894513:898163:- [translate_table: standard]
MWDYRPACRALWVVVCTLALLSIPEIVFVMRSQHLRTKTIALVVAGIFVLMALPITLFEIIQHLENYTLPREQKRVIRILLMVPVYAVASWMSLCFKDLAIYIDTVRECYEAYVIYSFFEYLLAYIGGEHTLGQLLVDKPQIQHIFPFDWILKPWPMGPTFVVVRPLTTMIAMFCEWGGVYGEGELDFHKSFIYLSFINNASQIWAIYCLVMFYHAAYIQLRPMRPFSKFLCVKAVVFFSFWQSMLIALLVKIGIIRVVDPNADYDVDDLSTGIQNFLICIEMFIAAIAHAYAFSPQEYVNSCGAKGPFWDSVRDMFDISDITTDMYGRVSSTTYEIHDSVTKLANQAIHVVPLPLGVMPAPPPGGGFDLIRSSPRKPAIPLPELAADSNSLLGNSARSDV